MTSSSTARTWKDAALMALAAAMVTVAVALVAPPAAHAAGDSGTALAAGSAQVQSAQKRYDINELGWKLGKKYMKWYGSTIKGKPYTSGNTWWHIDNCIYDGTPQYKLFPGADDVVAYDEDGKKFKPERGVDFEVDYRNNVNVGTASVHIRGIGKYKGSIPAGRYKIWPRKLNVLEVHANGTKRVVDYSVYGKTGRNWLDTSRKALSSGDVKMKLSYDGFSEGTEKKFLSQVKPRFHVDWSKMPESLKGKVKVNSKTGTLTLKKGKWATTAKLAKKSKLKTYKHKGKRYVGIPLKVKMTSGKNVKLGHSGGNPNFIYKTYTVPTSRVLMVRIA